MGKALVAPSPEILALELEWSKFVESPTITRQEFLEEIKEALGIVLSERQLRYYEQKKLLPKCYRFGRSARYGEKHYKALLCLYILKEKEGLGLSEILKYKNN